jgi:hypothetical protein
VLVEATSLAPQPAAPRVEPSSPIFRGSLDRPLGRRIHHLGHDPLGRLGPSIVPIVPGSNGRGPYDQAVLN